MKQLQKSDLKEGDIYVAGKSMTFINKEGTDKYIQYSTICSPSFHKSGGFSYNNMREATSEEKHWLETCIKLDKFISFEEAMKTFIPEYVECIEESVYDYGTNVIGKIYKVFGVTPNHINPDYLIEYGGIRYLSVSKHRFKPSTKEAYDAQFVVKEPEFVLPENWCVKTTLSNKNILQDYLQNNIINYPEYLITWEVINDRYFHIKGHGYGGGHSSYKIFDGFIEITFGQFKKYVLKEDVKVLEEPIIELKDSILEYRGEVKHTDQAISVQSSEGGIFKIGDKITPFDKDNPNKGKPFTITGFRWNNAKTDICAITNGHQNVGIRLLSKIELYIEPKKELSLLEQAKLRYPIGTKYIPTLRFLYKTPEISNGLFIESSNFISNAVNHTSIYNKTTGKWAEIVDDFVLPENWYIKVTDDNKEVLQQYIRNIHNSTSITLSNINYVAYSKWLNGINKTENKLGHGLISKLNLNPLPNIYRTVAYYNGVEITFEQFKKYVLK